MGRRGSFDPAAPDSLGNGNDPYVPAYHVVVQFASIPTRRFVCSCMWKEKFTAHIATTSAMSSLVTMGPRAFALLLTQGLDLGLPLQLANAQVGGLW